MTTRVPGAALALILALTLTACGGTNPSGTPGSSTPTPSTADLPTTDRSTTDAAAHNAVDVMFATMMIPHHQGAIEMSDVALAQASTQQVKDLAERIKAAQGPEIEQMQGWLAEWDATMPMSTASQDVGHGMEHGSPSTGASTPASAADDFGMGAMMTMSEADMTALRASTGVEFDKLFLQQMIAHHQGAVDMADVEIGRGQYPATVALAESIRTGQTAEITEMQQLLTTL